MGIEAISSSMMSYDRTAMAQSQAANSSSSAEKTAAAQAPKAGGTPPAGGGGGAKKAASSDSTSSSSSTSSSTKTYDPADTNQDGTVSYEEAVRYSLMHPNNEKAQEKVTTASANQLQSALSAYQQSGGSAGGSSMQVSA
jgi:hypothetical protein